MHSLLSAWQLSTLHNPLTLHAAVAHMLLQAASSCCAVQAAPLWNILRVVQSLHQRQVAHFDLSPSQFAWFTGEISQESFDMHWQLWHPQVMAVPEPALLKPSLKLSTADLHGCPPRSLRRQMPSDSI